MTYPDIIRNLEYQEGSIVSRELIKKSVGTVTLFAFDKGQGLSTHTAPFDAFVYITEGEALITIDGEERTLQEGDTVVMPAGKPHSLDAKEPFKMLLVMIKEKV